MVDVWHQFGSDLVVNSTGDFMVASTSEEGQQRVLRRLLTNVGDYIWQLGYGAGLGQFVGGAAGVAQIRAVIRGQIFKESAVARSPEPVINVQADTSGTVYAYVQYADSVTGNTQVLSFSVGNGTQT